jgi:hypothetical protein
MNGDSKEAANELRVMHGCGILLKLWGGRSDVLGMIFPAVLSILRLGHQAGRT